MDQVSNFQYPGYDIIIIIITYSNDSEIHAKIVMFNSASGVKELGRKKQKPRPRLS